MVVTVIKFGAFAKKSVDVMCSYPEFQQGTDFRWKKLLQGRRVMRFLTIIAVLFMSVGAFAQTGQYSDLIGEYFGNDGVLSSTVCNQLGRGVISLLHPTSDHTSTTVVSSNSQRVRFRTNYQGWINEHVLVWEVTLSPTVLISDVNFVSDTSPIQSGMAANLVKSTLIDLFVRAMR